MAGCATFAVAGDSWWRADGLKAARGHWESLAETTTKCQVRVGQTGFALDHRGVNGDGAKTEDGEQSERTELVSETGEHLELRGKHNSPNNDYLKRMT